MFNPIRTLAIGATKRGSEEYFGQLLAFGGLYLTAKVAGKVHDYFTAPIKVETEAIDHEEVDSGNQSEE